MREVKRQHLQAVVKCSEEESDVGWRVVELNRWKPLIRRLIDRLWEREQVSKDFGMSLELSPMHLKRNTSCDENDVAIFEPDIGLRDGVRRGCHSGWRMRERGLEGTESVGLRTACAV